ncbi:MULTISPECIES: type II secretion system protein [unclassified Nitratiruptor]|uniref:type II secretion system protein n=1 Tax=unclassified Nitratiruptor TaxID=2624044 RepID=UPI0019151396|nr:MULTISPECIES: hypothetical protein [unclassified Nitratiruptor]BCD60876.1 hypothetical protein NitYY0810_C1654 [Nitratiruptor sp. YY08-10]BCD64808.1 hypothetical protein NitYY0814_C1662 [Nitratiruptor sp. YY08-14]
MRKALTLLELIFSMVIIAIAFTVFPKILQVSSKTSVHALKEEALYQAVAMMGLVKTLPWDERNTLFDDYLFTDQGSSDYECSTSFGGAPIYRKGGFVGSRNCKHHQNATSALGMEANDHNIPDDVDDFVTLSPVTVQNFNASRQYELNISINYVDDLSLSDTNFTTGSSGGSTNTKYITISVSPLTKSSAFAGKTLAQVWYFSENIGQIRINRLPWRR